MATIAQIQARLQQATTRPTRVVLDIRVESSEFAEYIRKRWKPERIAKITKDFLDGQFMDVIMREFNTLTADDDSIPDIMPNPYKGMDAWGKLEGKERDIMREADPTNMYAGFDVIRSIFKKTLPISAPGYAGAGAGPTAELMGVQAWPFMPLRHPPRNSKLTSLWMTVEFGTGIAKNVGGPQHVNVDPTSFTKEDFGGRYIGAWWFPRPYFGIYSLGQKGLHWLHDETTKEPRTPEYMQKLGIMFKDYLQRRL